MEITQNQGFDWEDIQKELPKAKIILRENTARAIKEGVCGVPSILANKELWWGQDRLYDVMNHLGKS